MTAAPDARVTELQTRIAAIDASLADLDAQWNSLAAGDITDQSTLKAAAIIETRIGNLKREKALVLAAGAQLELKREAEQEQVEKEAKRKQLLEAKQLSDQIASVHVEIDRQLLSLREAFAKRATLLRALSATGQCDATFVNKLLGKASPTRAACHARLHDVLAMEVPAPGSQVPLSSSNVVLLAIGKDLEPDPPPLQRRRLKNGDGAP
jgi:hypothetical protein